MPVFYQCGLHEAPDAVLATGLNTSVAGLTAQFPSRELLVHHAMLADMERQKQEHVELYAQYPSAVERLYGLLQVGLRDLASIPGNFYAELQAGFSRTWEALMSNMNTYSPPPAAAAAKRRHSQSRVPFRH